jgi:hypothetical protein
VFGAAEDGLLPFELPEGTVFLKLFGVLLWVDRTVPELLLIRVFPD